MSKAVFNSYTQSRQERYENMHIAIGLFKGGGKAKFSVNDIGHITAGYGELDKHGEFEYPLPVDQETGNINVILEA